MKTTTEFQNMAEAIQAAYINSINEGAEDPKPKFKVGAKVGIGRYSHDGMYNPIDTGTVSKVHKNGEHEVTYDTHEVKNFDLDKPVMKVAKFNHAGYSTIAKYNGGHKIIDIEQHNDNVKSLESAEVRRNDLQEVVRHLTAKQNLHGHQPPLSKSHVEHLKALLDKHTEQ